MIPGLLVANWFRIFLNREAEKRKKSDKGGREEDLGETVPFSCQNIKTREGNVKEED